MDYTLTQKKYTLDLDDQEMKDLQFGVALNRYGGVEIGFTYPNLLQYSTEMAHTISLPIAVEPGYFWAEWLPSLWDGLYREMETAGLIKPVGVSVPYEHYQVQKYELTGELFEIYERLLRDFINGRI